MYSCVSAAKSAVQKYAALLSGEAEFTSIVSQADTILAKFSKLTFPDKSAFIDRMNFFISAKAGLTESEAGSAAGTGSDLNDMLVALSAVLTTVTSTKFTFLDSKRTQFQTLSASFSTEIINAGKEGDSAA